MKLWILSSETPHFQAGGIARYVDNFARLAAAAGTEVTVIARGAADDEREVAPRYQLVEFKDRTELAARHAGPVEPDAHPAWPYNNMTPPAAQAWQMAEVVIARIGTAGPPDVIECQDYAALGYFLMQRKLCGEPLLQEIPILLHLHTPDFIVQQLNQYPRFKLPDYWIGRMERACIRMADAVLSPSRFLAGEIQSHLDGPRGDIEVISYPLPDPVAPYAPAGQRPDTLLYAGRIELRKGVEELLRACDRLWAEGEQFRVELAGGDVHTPLRGGSLRAYLERRYASRIAEGRLAFLGPVDHDRCRALMRGARAVLVPSLWENFPNTCIEAMLAGRPVVASDCGGQAEMIGGDGAAGILFDHSQPGALAAAIRRVLAMPDAETGRMGEAARARISTLCDPAIVLAARLEHLARVRAAHQPAAVYPFSNRRLREGPHAAPLPEDPLVTAIVPFYNLGVYLRECVDSILASDGVNLELLIVNDGSTDPASIAALDALRARGDPRVRVLDIPNGGLANTRNVGAGAARGELIAFVDADDAVTPAFLRRAVEVLRRYPNVHLAYSWVRFFDDGRGIWHSWTFDLPYLLCHNQLVPIVVVRRDSFLRHGRNKPHIVYGLEDYEGWISMAEAGCGGVAIPETLVRYRVRPDSMFKVIEPDKKLYLYDLITAEHPRLCAEYGLELFNLLNANGPAHAWDQPTMFRSPQDRLAARLHAAEVRTATLEDENRRLREAEAWHKKERDRLVNGGG